MIKNYIVYIIGGGCGSVICLTTTYFLKEYFGFWYFSAYAMGMIMSTVFNFSYHRSITFKNKSQVGARFLKFFLTSALVVFVSLLLIYLSTDILKIWYLLSGFLVVTLMSLLSFYLSSFWVFKVNEA